jgi:excisionase family DNA binding protein
MKMRPDYRRARKPLNENGTMTANEKMLIVREAALLLRMSVSLVYALCKARKLRHERYGLGRGTIRIPIEAIEEYRQSCTVGPVKKEPALPPKPSVKLRHLRPSSRRPEGGQGAA